MSKLTPYQIDWLRANVASFSYVERTCGDVQRDARNKVAQQRCPKGWDWVQA